MVRKVTKKGLVDLKGTPGPGSYNTKSFVDSGHKTGNIFGSAPRFKKPPTYNSKVNLNQGDRKSMNMSRYFDRFGKQGPFVTLKGRYRVK